MLRRLEEGKFTVEEVCSTEVVQRIPEKLKHVQSSMKNQRNQRFKNQIGPCTSNRFMTCFLILRLLVTDFMLNRPISTYKLG